MSLPTFTMMVGLPGSGKSYYAKELSDKESNTFILSSDSIRLELFGDENEQGKNEIVFNELHKRVHKLLSDGLNVIYDATNLNSKRRRKFLKTLTDKGIACKKRCIIMATPYTECLKQNESRTRNVPKEVIRNMREKFQTPYYFEGWDEIRIVNEWAFTYGGILPIVSFFCSYDQCNSHHTKTLGNHLMKVYHDVCNETNNSRVRMAALLHDIGKPFVRSFTNAKGEVTEDAHYYHHENVGAYETLFFNMGDDTLYTSALVAYHMLPFTWKTEKVHEKYMRIFGEKMYKDIMLIHEADKGASS